MQVGGHALLRVLAAAEQNAADAATSKPVLEGYSIAIR